MNHSGMNSHNNNYTIDDIDNDNNHTNNGDRMSEVEMNDMNNTPQQRIPNIDFDNDNSIPLDHMDYSSSLPMSSEELRMDSSTSFSANHNNNGNGNGMESFDDVDMNDINNNNKVIMTMSDSSNNKKRRMWISIIVMLCLVGLIIGLAIGIPNKKEKENNASSSAVEETPQVDITTLRTYLLNQYNIKTHDDTSPQYIAARYMSTYDLYNMKLPGYSNGTDPIDNAIYSYRFLARYIMILNYFSFGGIILNWNNEEYNSTWYNQLNFLSDNDICDWKGYVIGLYRIEVAGIKCSPFIMDDDTPPQLVPTELALIYNNLTGTIPTENGLLTTLTVFDIKYNRHVSGSIPTELCQLTNLRSFFIGYNSIMDTIPECIGNLKKLRRLFASNNMLDGTLPSSFNQLNELERLFIDDNALEDKPLPLLSNMKNLSMIVINNNLFSGMIDEQFVLDHKELILLDISNNNFTLSFDDKVIPTLLFQLPYLQLLDLSHNDLAGSIPNEINDNTKLLFLALYDNAIRGTIPKSIMNLSSLESFDISNNFITGIIPSEIQYIQNLSLLYLSNNPFLASGPIPLWLSSNNIKSNDDTNIKNDMTTFTRLEEISIRNTNRNNTIPSELGTIRNLELLDIGGNKLSGTVPITLRNLQQLQFLLMNNNTLINGNISSVLNNTNTLRALFIDGTNITDDFDNTLCLLDNIRPLNNDGEIIYADCDGRTRTVFCKCCACCDSLINAGCSKPQLDNLDGKWETAYQRITYKFLNRSYLDSDFQAT